MSQPRGLYLLFATETWERFSFYGMRVLLVLYMVSAITDGGFGWDRAYALNIFGSYLGLAYITPLIGGYIADHWIGQRRSVLIGGVLMALGHCLMAVYDEMAFFAALFLIAVGNGFFKPNLTSILGGLYKTGDSRRDAGYSLFYMGINLGGIFSGFVTGWLQQNYGFDYGFASAAVGMFVGLVLFWSLQNHFLGDVGMKPIRVEEKEKRVPLNAQQKDRIGVIFLASFALVVFVMAFEQMGGLINLFAKEWTERQVGGMLIPTAYFQSLNPIFIVIYAPLLSMFWSKLGKRDPFFSVKLVGGFLLTFIGFLIIAGVSPETADIEAYKVHWSWLVIYQAFVTLGELCIIPVIWSAVSKLSPKQYTSTMMAISLGAIGLGSYLSGFLGSYVDDWGPKAVFMFIAWVSLALAVIMIFLTPKMKKLSHGAI